MKRARFTEEQIIGILRENEAGAKAGELARKAEKEGQLPLLKSHRRVKWRCCENGRRGAMSHRDGYEANVIEIFLAPPS